MASALPGLFYFASILSLTAAVPAHDECSMPSPFSPEPSGRTPVLRASGLVKHFAGRRVLDHVNLEIAAGMGLGRVDFAALSPVEILLG